MAVRCMRPGGGFSRTYLMGVLGLRLLLQLQAWHRDYGNGSCWPVASIEAMAQGHETMEVLLAVLAVVDNE